MSVTNGQLSEAFYKVNALGQEQRDAAYEAARKRIAGDEPILRYEHTQGRFSPRFMLCVQIAVAVMMLVAFLPSAMRIHAVALDAFARIIATDIPSQYWGALCTVLLAEACQIVFSIAFATALNRYERIAYGIGAASGTAIALLGNGAASQLNISTNAITFKDLFALLETFAPPVITLIAAWVLKTQIMHATEARTQAQAQHANAIALWKTAFVNASQNAEWGSVLANALRDALRNANRRSYAVVRELTDSDWRALVIRERNSEEWWKQAENAAQKEQDRVALETERNAVRNGTMSTGATGEVANAQTKRKGNAFVKVCPHCIQEFAGDTERQATNRLVAHMKKHSNERKAAAIADAIQSQETSAVPLALAS